MKILLLGGTGAMGRNLAEILAKDNHNVYVTSRQKRNDSNNIKYLQGNALDNTFLKETLKNKYDAIVDFMMYNDCNDFKDRINLFLKNTKNYIFLSSSRVYTNQTRKINEKCKRLLETSTDKTFINNNDYPILKCKQEDILKNQNQKNYTIIRPYITYDNERLQLGIYEKEKWLYRALHGKSIVFSKDLLDVKTTMSYGYDVAQHIAKLIEKEKASGEIYQITTTNAITWGEILEIYVKAIKELTNIKVKVKLVDHIYDTKILNPDWQYEYDRKYNREFDSSKIIKLTGIKDGCSPTEGLKNCLKEFLKKMQFRKISWRDEAVKDKLCSEKTKVSDINSLKNKVIYIFYRYTDIILLENLYKKIKRQLKNYIKKV